jgi:hypothetical protein
MGYLSPIIGYMLRATQTNLMVFLLPTFTVHFRSISNSKWNAIFSAASPLLLWRVFKMSTVVSKEGCQLLLSDARGVYIPRDFAEGFDLTAWHIDFDVSALFDLEGDFYWDTWERVLNNAYLIEGEYRFTLHHDGDLWAICPELMTELEKLHFFGEV